MQDLTISFIQLDTVWEDIKANLSRLTELVKNLGSNVDLLVLPETFSTGFTMEAKRLSETMEGSAVRWMQGQAVLRDLTVCGSLIIEEEGQYYNRFIFAHANGKIEYYNKRHLFALTGEQNHFKPGNKNVLINIKGWKIRPQICYDLRFPVWSKNTEEYDLLIYTANWPEKRIEHWRKLLMARAIENQSYALGVNCFGKDGNDISYNGNSMLVAPMGDVVIEKTGEEVLETVTLNHDNIVAFRNFQSVLQDGDSFSVEE
jgi:omega-amidase